MKLFRRDAAHLPSDATETWDEQESRVIIHLPADTSRMETHESSGALTQRLIDTAQAIRSGEVGSVIPSDVAQATVAIQIEPTHRDLGELELSAVEIIRGQLGDSIPILTVPGANPPPPVEDTSLPDPATLPISMTWDEATGTVLGHAPIPATNGDLQTSRLLQRTLDGVFAALAQPDTLAAVPADRRDDLFFSVTFDLGEAIVGPRTTALIERIKERFADTRLSVHMQLPVVDR